MMRQRQQQSQQINLNFQVVPTAAGPLIVQKGVTVQPNTLDHLYSQMKISNPSTRPVSARIRGNDSFHSSQSWDGAAHFRSAAIRIGFNRGDDPGLGKRYNPTRNRRKNSANRGGGQQNNSNHQQSHSQQSLDEHHSSTRQIELSISNCDGKMSNSKINAYSQTDRGTDKREPKHRQKRDTDSCEDFNDHNASLSPDSGHNHIQQQMNKFQNMIKPNVDFKNSSDFGPDKPPHVQTMDAIGTGSHGLTLLNQKHKSSPQRSDLEKNMGKKPDSEILHYNSEQINQRKTNQNDNSARNLCNEFQASIADQQQKPGTDCKKVPDQSGPQWMNIEESKHNNGTSFGCNTLDSCQSNSNLKDLVNFKNFLNQERKGADHTQEQDNATDQVLGSYQQSQGESLTFAPNCNTVGPSVAGSD